MKHATFVTEVCHERVLITIPVNTVYEKEPWDIILIIVALGRGGDRQGKQGHFVYNIKM